METLIDSLREAFFRHAVASLEISADETTEWQSVRASLKSLGFKLAADTPIGFFPGVAALKAQLVHDGFTADEIVASRLLGDSRLSGQLVGPIRDPQGRILSFWARQTEQQGPRYLYLSTRWKDETAVFGLDVALPAVVGGKHDLLLVEDLLDALYLQSQGLPYVAAIGSSAAEMTERRWQRLAELGVYRVTLAVAPRRAAADIARDAALCAAKASVAPAVYLLPSQELPDGQSPAELVRSAGPAALEQLLSERRIHSYQALALDIAAKHKASGDWTTPTRRAALDEAIRFFNSVHQRNIPAAEAFFLPTILWELELSWDRLPAEQAPAWGNDAALASGHDVNDPDGDPREDLYDFSPQGTDVGNLDATPGSDDPDESPRPDVEDDDLAREESVGEGDVLALEGDSLEGNTVEQVAEASIPADVSETEDGGEVMAGIEPPARDVKRPAVPEDFCSFHQCDGKVCLCWD